MIEGMGYALSYIYERKPVMAKEVKGFCLFGWTARILGVCSSLLLLCHVGLVIIVVCNKGEAVLVFWLKGNITTIRNKCCTEKILKKNLKQNVAKSTF